jgi:predicted esterase
MRIKSLLVILVYCIIVSGVNAQSVHDFRTGLAVPRCHRYGREAIVTDEIAYQLSMGTFKTPEEGGKAFTDAEGKQIYWSLIQCDSTGKFRGSSLMNGYIYLTYQSSTARHALLNVSGNVMAYVNGEPRGGDIYGDGWMNIPVRVKKGLNEILIRCGSFSRQGVNARLTFPDKPISLSIEDAIIPHIVIGQAEKQLLAAIVVVNNSEKPLNGYILRAVINGAKTDNPVGNIKPGMFRKTAFYFDARNISEKGDHACRLQLMYNGKIVDETSLNIAAVTPGEHHSYTFVSDIDGSVQYYSVAPQTAPGEKPALFLSVHGAGVQAIGQARAYKSKDWGVLVAPTNRRPRGFNWEDWGRIDALEVFELAKKRFNPDPERIYLTGHSMGGHGTWYLGATYPDKWAAIAPCAGYPTLTGYGSADGKIPDSARTATERTLLRASNASNVIALAGNYKSHGVYVFHGDEDRTVPVAFARQMRDILGAFHPDFTYYEYPGGSHWFGSESVDWPPLFEYFRWHKLKADSVVNAIDFVTADPAISSRCRWLSIVQQQQPLAFSKINLVRDKAKRTFIGSTENISLLKLEVDGFNAGDTLSISLDSHVIHYVIGSERELYFSRADKWTIATQPIAKEKNAVRSGTFKEAFNHKMIFVYGTIGNDAENHWAYTKARYDAEVWYYRGNGSVEIYADKEFDPAKFPDRGIILYGNSATNSAWNKLLSSCPVQVSRDHIAVGAKTFPGNDLGAYFIWPRPDSNIASVAVIAGTGLPGLKATEANQYFAAGSGFPDYVVFSASMLTSGAAGTKAAGFYDNQWRINEK